MHGRPYIILNPPKKRRGLKFFLSLVIIALISALAIYIYDKFIRPDEQPLGYFPIGSYEKVDKVAKGCEAQLPGCGYCPGKEAYGKCYVKLTEMWQWMD